MDVEHLYQVHSRPLFSYLVRLTGDAELAADVVQETFVRLVERPPTEGPLTGWLYRVASNLVREMGRKSSNRLRLLGTHPHRVPQPDAPPDPAADLERRERQRAVRTALASLSPRARMALLMRGEGFSYREIAEALETTTDSVGTILARALEKLAKQLPLDEVTG